MNDDLRCSKVFSIKNTNSDGYFGHYNRFTVFDKEKKSTSNLKIGL